MATYFVDFVNGNDANNGLGPDASHATNKPWKTIAKLTGAAGFASGDTAYLSPAGPFREVVTVAMTSAVAETKIIGDPANAQGFKTSGGVAVAAGYVQWTAYTTNDKTAPSATTLLNLSGRDFLTFQYIMLVGGSANPATVTAATTTSTSITFKDCHFHDSKYLAGNTIRLDNAAGVAFTWLFDRCTFVGVPNPGSAGVLMLIQVARTAADYDYGVIIRNCRMIGQKQVSVVATGAGAGFGGGLVFRNNAVLFGGGVITGASTATSIPIQAQNNFFYTGNTALSANTLGQIVEDYNLIASITPRTNVTAGTHSISDNSYSPLFQAGQEALFGYPLRVFGEPMASSPLLAFGNDGNQTATDFRNRIRPAGGASASPAAGAMDRSNTFITDSSPIGDGGTAIKCTGPAYAEFYVPVPARPVTISVVVKWDATYAGTKPQLQIDANGRIGVSAETITATGSSGSNETLTLTRFTPSHSGDMVTIRVISNDTNGSGLLQVDNFTVVG